MAMQKTPPGESAQNRFKARTPIDIDSVQPVQGQVHVIPERCKECGYCVQFCPQQVLEFSEDINAKGYHYPVLRSQVTEDGTQHCVHCEFCNLICPELAIYTEEVTTKT